ncbi:PiggyBac transposable element-derived protein 4, partial [Camponotus floridanus]
KFKLFCKMSSTNVKLYIHSERNICIDESLLLWKERLSWKQYILSKRNRFGIKFFALCKNKTGYIL